MLGSSGCGKTTLLRVLAGYQRSTTGIVTVAGKRHTEPDPDVGVVFQRPNLFPWLTIAKNVEFGQKNERSERSGTKTKGSRHFGDGGTLGSGEFLPLSAFGGCQATISDRRTLAAEPAIILMDEPLAHSTRSPRINPNPSQRHLAENRENDLFHHP
ncbi:MAG UNVERIFIED_CONTAM: ATP-binding cassette domain-containing protein [Microcystis novacekii LVE1205-3]